MNDKLFHISEEPSIGIFEPRPSPSHFENITGDVVFAISGRLLHNYLLPRDCPRVTFYAGLQTTDQDKSRFFGESMSEYVVTVPSGWYSIIKNTILYCYEFDPVNFTLLDECAGYYTSYQNENPVVVTEISDLISELVTRNIELRFSSALLPLADAVSRSSLNFSLIRMRNALA